MEEFQRNERLAIINNNNNNNNNNNKKSYYPPGGPCITYEIGAPTRIL
jgi:hypothetical protein